MCMTQTGARPSGNHHCPRLYLGGCVTIPAVVRLVRSHNRGDIKLGQTVFVQHLYRHQHRGSGGEYLPPYSAEVLNCGRETPGNDATNQCPRCVISVPWRLEPL